MPTEAGATGGIPARIASHHTNQGARSKTMSKFLSLVIIFGAVIFFTTSVRNTVPVAAQDSKGKKDAPTLYKQYCVKCHGADGKGLESLKSVDIPDFTDAKWQASRTDQTLTESITQGKGVMPGMKDTISAEEIGTLTQHVRAFNAAAKKKK